MLLPRSLPVARILTPGGVPCRAQGLAAFQPLSRRMAEAKRQRLGALQASALEQNSDYQPVHITGSTFCVPGTRRGVTDRSPPGLCC